MTSTWFVWQTVTSSGDVPREILTIVDSKCAAARVYTSGGGVRHDDPRARDRTVVGGKGANLAEMAGIGLPAPPDFTITTKECFACNAGGKTLSTELKAEIRRGIQHIEQATEFHVGNSGAEVPLPISVRSGALVSMPGRMETVLSLGLNDETGQALSQSPGDARFAWGSYRRFIQMYAEVVFGLNTGLFGQTLDLAKLRRGFESDRELLAGDFCRRVGGL